MSVSWVMLLTVIATQIDTIPATSTTAEPTLVIDIDSDNVFTATQAETNDFPTEEPPTLPTTTHDHIDIGCNYINTRDVAIPTDVCHLSIYNGMQQSYMYRCNDNAQYPSSNTPIVLLFWPHSHCNSTDSIAIDVDDITDYFCVYTDTNNDKCIPNQLVITQYHPPHATETCVYNENYKFMETQIINICIQSWDTSAYIKYECNDNEILIDYYSDSECNDTEWITTTKIVRNDDCIDGSIIQHSCALDDIQCDYVNYDGFARRIGVCHPAPYKGFVYEYYALQCNDVEDIETDGAASVAWWGPDGCIGDPLRIYPLNTQYDIIDYKCSASNVSNICPTEDVLILQKFDDTDCVKDDTAYHMVDIMLNTCVKDGNGGAKKVQCELDSNQQNNGYKISNYKDENCEELLTEENYGDVACPDSDRLQFVIWCDGANEIEYLDEKCEYFINNEHLDHERKYLIHALNKCSEFMLNGGYFSNQYVCNSDNSGVQEIWYKGKQCEDGNEIGRHDFDDNKNNFNCYHGLISDEDDDNGCDVDDALLKLRWYIKDPLNEYSECMKKKGFHQDNYIITGVCAPDYVNDMNGYSVYTMIECDHHHLDWYVIGYYSDSKCSNKLDGIRFESGQCFNGNIVDIKGCKGKGDEYSDYMDSSSSASSSSDVLPIVVNEM